MIDKRVDSLEAAMQGIADGATVLIPGFGGAGLPNELIEALCDQPARHLTMVTNTAETGPGGLARLLSSGRVDKVICSFARSPAGSKVFDTMFLAGNLALEIVPQGTLAERIRAGAAGIGGFYTRTGVGTPLAEGRETRVIDGETYLFEKPIRGDVALLKAAQADRWGNLVYRRAARNFNPVMAAAAKLSIAQVAEIVELGAIDPDQVMTPGIYVDRVVRI